MQVFLSNGKKVNPIGWFDLKIRGEKAVLMTADRSEEFKLLIKMLLQLYCIC